MALSLTRKGPKPTLASINSIEDALGVKLPDPFKKFLMSHNAGTATGYYFLLKREKRYLNSFLSVRRSNTGPMAILDVRKNCAGIIPEDSIPIAFVDGSNLLLIRTKRQRRGGIDLKIDADAGLQNNPEAGIVRIATSIGEFVKRLKFVEPSELDEDDYGLW